MKKKSCSQKISKSHRKKIASKWPQYLKRSTEKVFSKNAKRNPTTNASNRINRTEKSFCFYLKMLWNESNVTRYRETEKLWYKRYGHIIICLVEFRWIGIGKHKLFYIIFLLFIENSIPSYNNPNLSAYKIYGAVVVAVTIFFYLLRFLIVYFSRRTLERFYNYFQLVYSSISI